MAEDRWPCPQCGCDAANLCECVAEDRRKDRWTELAREWSLRIGRLQRWVILRVGEEAVAGAGGTDLHEMRCVLYEDGWDSVGNPADRLRKRLRTLREVEAALAREREVRRRLASACECLLEVLTMGPLEAAARYGPDYDSREADASAVEQATKALSAAAELDREVGNG